MGCTLFVLVVVPRPVVGAAHGLVPAAQPLAALFLGDVRHKHFVDSVFFRQFLRPGPEADGQTCQVRRTQGGGLHRGRPLHRRVADVGLGLQQVVVGRRAAVHFQRGQTDAGVDKLAKQVFHDLAKHSSGMPNPRGGYYEASLFAFFSSTTSTDGSLLFEPVPVTT